VSTVAIVLAQITVEAPKYGAKSRAPAISLPSDPAPTTKTSSGIGGIRRVPERSTSLSGAVAVTRPAMLPGAYPPPARVRAERAGYRPGMSLFSKVSRFARSSQGKKAMEKAKDFASKPETKEKIEQVREKVSGKDKQQAAGAGDKATAGPAAAGTPGSEPSSPGPGGSEPAAGGTPGSEPAKPAAGGTPPVNEPAGAGEQPAQGNPPQTP
jgi:hypothetical protein